MKLSQDNLEKKTRKRFHFLLPFKAFDGLRANIFFSQIKVDNHQRILINLTAPVNVTFTSLKKTSPEILSAWILLFNDKPIISRGEWCNTLKDGGKL